MSQILYEAYPKKKKVCGLSEFNWACYTLYGNFIPKAPLEIWQVCMTNYSSKNRILTSALLFMYKTARSTAEVNTEKLQASILLSCKAKENVTVWKNDSVYKLKAKHEGGQEKRITAVKNRNSPHGWKVRYRRDTE